jgi:acyl-CoA thioester hydrolase
MIMRSRENNGPFNIFAETEITVEFYELDPMGVVWHGNYINYFETGRRTLLEKIGYDYEEIEKSGFVFPVVDVSLRYLRSLKFRDKARVKAILMEYENCLQIKYEIYNAETGLLTTKGLTTQMAYNAKSGESCFVCPRTFIERVEALIKGKPKDESKN